MLTAFIILSSTKIYKEDHSRSKNFSLSNNFLVCCHPYLFNGAVGFVTVRSNVFLTSFREPGLLSVTDKHMVENAGKMQIHSKLLKLITNDESPHVPIF